MNQQRVPSYQYQVGGSLPTNAPTYVNREADNQLYQALRQGEFCYVLNSRQMGKSSLRVQTMQRLQTDDFACVAIDITNIGTADTSAEQWYAGIIDSIISSLGLYNNFDLNDWWEEQGLLSPVNKLSKFFESVLLTSISQNIVIFIDEIDSVLSLNFKVDDFFALIRECYNSRASQPEYERLTFALLGVANPGDLIQDKRRTPFNIGTAIELTGFQLGEAEPLAQGLAEKTSNPMEVMSEILYWTGGQPFLTQKLCKLILNQQTIPENGVARWLEELVRSQIINNWEAQDEPEHLKTIRDRLLRGGGGQLAGRLLAIYKEVIEGGNHSPVRTADIEEQVYLRLSGLVVEQQGTLRVYNRIYESIFNLNWVNQELKDVRPDFYTQPFEAWLESNGEDTSHLLRGENLSNALAWAQGKSLSNEDYRFISDSQKWQFAQARKKTKRQTLFGAIALAVSLVFVSFGVMGAQRGIEGAQRAQKAEDAQKQAEDARKKAEAERKQAEAARKKAEAKRKKAEAEQKNALTKVENVEKQEKAARKRAADAQRQAADAQRQADFQKQQAEAQRRQAEAQRRQAEAQRRQVETARRQAEAQTQQAEVAKKEAEAQRKEAEAQRKEAEAQRKEAKAQKEQTDKARQQAETARQQAETARQQAETARAGVETAKRQAEDARRQAADAREELEGTEIEQIAQDALQQFEHNETPQVAALAMKALKKHKEKDPRLQNIPPRLELALNTVLTIPERITLEGDTKGVINANFSPKGRYVVAASNDNTVKVWDTSTGKLSKTLKHEDNVRSATFSPDDRYIVTASNDDTAKLWDASTGQLFKTLKHEDDVNHASFSPKGRYIVTRSSNTAKVWDTSTGKLRKTIEHPNSVFNATFSQDGTRIFTASLGIVKVWDISTGKETTTKINSSSARTDFSRDGRYFVTASSRTTNVWEISTGKLIGRLVGHNFEINDITFSPDGKHIVTASSDNTAKVWNIKEEKEKDGKVTKVTVELSATLKGHQGGVRHAAIFSPNNKRKRIVTTSTDGTARIWDTDGNLLKTLAGNQDTVRNANFSSDGNSIVTASNDGKVKVWNIEDKLVKTFRYDSRTLVRNAAFNFEGNRIFTNSNTGRVTVWNASTGEQISALTKQLNKYSFSTINPVIGNLIVGRSRSKGEARILNLSTGEPTTTLEKYGGSGGSPYFSQDGKYVLAISNDNERKVYTVKVWNARGRRIDTSFIRNSSPVSRADFSPDGRYIVTASDNTAKVWNVSTGKLHKTLKGHQSRIRHVAFSPDSRNIVTSSNDNTARVWESSTNNNSVPKILRRQNRVTKSVFSPDGTEILTASTDTIARRWDVETGELLQTFEGHHDFVRSAVFSPEANQIVTASDDFTAKLWSLETVQQLQKRGCELLEDYFQNHTNQENERNETGCPQQQRIVIRD